MAVTLESLKTRPTAKTRRWRDGGSSYWWMLFLACCGLVLAGCARTVTWKEEVKLSDGRVVVVEREVLRTPGGDDLAHGGSGSTPKEEHIRFEFPIGSGQLVEWKSTKTSPSLVPEIPLVLDAQKDEPFIMTIVAISTGCERYLKYVYANRQWHEEPLAEQFEAKPTNLFLKSSPNMPSYVGLDTKNNKNKNIRYSSSLKKAGPRRIVCGD